MPNFWSKCNWPKQSLVVLKQNPPLKRAQNNLDISLGSRLTPASPRILNPIPKLTHCKVCPKNWHEGLRSFIHDQFELINSKSSLQFKIYSLEYELNRGPDDTCLMSIIPSGLDIGKTLHRFGSCKVKLTWVQPPYKLQSHLSDEHVFNETWPPHWHRCVATKAKENT